MAESPAFGTERITAIGEPKGTRKPVGLPQLEQLEQLEHLRGLLPSATVGALPKASAPRPLWLHRRSEA